MKKIIEKVKDELNEFLTYHPIWILLMLILMVILLIIAIVIIILIIMGYGCDSTTALPTTALSTTTTVFNSIRAIHF